MVDEKIDKRKIKEGDWVRVETVEEVGQDDTYREHPFAVEGIVYRMPADDPAGRTSELFVGCLWIAHRDNVVVEHRPKGSE